MKLENGIYRRIFNIQMTDPDDTDSDTDNNTEAASGNSSSTGKEVLA